MGKRQPLIPKVTVQTNDEDLSSDTSSEDENETYEPTAYTTNRNNQTNRRSKKKWSDAGLLLPANRFHRKLIAGKYAKKVSKDAAVAITGVIEYLVSEVLMMSKECADINRKKRIQPRHIMLAIRGDQEFSELLKDVTFPTSGVVPYIQEVLLPSATPSPVLRKRSLEQPGTSGHQMKKRKNLVPVQNDSDDSD